MSAGVGVSPADTDRAEQLLDQLLIDGTHPDPYPLYAQLREISPIYRSPGRGMWYATSHAVNSEMLTSPDFGQGPDGAAALTSSPKFATSAALQFMAKATVFLDPPQHTRIRKIVAGSFTRTKVRRVEPFLTEMVNDLLDAAEDKPTVDLIEDFAALIPVTAVGALLGVPRSDREQHLQWVRQFHHAIKSDATEADLDIADQGALGLREYFVDLIEERRNTAGEDLLTELIQIEEEGERLTSDELVALVVQLLIAGTETTIALIGLGTSALLRNPAQLQKLRDDPSLDDGAIEELLRFDAPMQADFPRLALRDSSLGGVPIPAGDFVFPILGAANRDDAFYTGSDDLDIERKSLQHLSFGKGIHLCLGAALARLEGRIAIGTLIRRYPDLGFASDPVLGGSFLLRFVTEMPVRLRP